MKDSVTGPKTNYGNSPPLFEEFYFVAVARASGLPSLVKAAHDRMYFSLEAAVEAREVLKAIFPDTPWVILKAVGTVKERLP